MTYCMMSWLDELLHASVIYTKLDLNVITIRMLLPDIAKAAFLTHELGHYKFPVTI